MTVYENVRRYWSCSCPLKYYKNKKSHIIYFPDCKSHKLFRPGYQIPSFWWSISFNQFCCFCHRTIFSFLQEKTTSVHALQIEWKAWKIKQVPISNMAFLAQNRLFNCLFMLGMLMDLQHTQFAEGLDPKNLGTDPFWTQLIIGSRSKSIIWDWLVIGFRSRPSTWTYNVFIYLISNRVLYVEYMIYTLFFFF